MKKSRLAAGLGLFVLALSSFTPAHAALIVDNGIPGVINPSGSNLSDTQQAQDFLLSSITSITSIRFWTLELSSTDYLNSIFWEIRNNSSGVPGTGVMAFGTSSSMRTASGTVSIAGTNYNQFQNDLTVNVNNLSAGFYWLTLHNGAITSTSFTDYYWSASDANNTAFLGQEKGLNPLTSWSSNEQELAFQLYGTSSASTPEPATFGLGGIALIMIGLSRRTNTLG